MTAHIGLFAYADMQALDLVGPLDVFGAANARAGTNPPYTLCIIGLDDGVVRAENSGYDSVSSWKTNQGISVATTPVTRETWSGQFAPGKSLVLHIIKHGASPTFSADIPSLHVVAALATVTGHGGKNGISVHVPGHTITFTGTANAKGTAVRGTYTQDGKSYPLTLERKAQPQA